MNACMERMMQMMGRAPMGESSGGAMDMGGMAGPSLWMMPIAGMPLWVIVLIVSSGLLLVSLGFALRWWRRRLSHDQRQALRILQLRLARGELAPDDYRTHVVALRVSRQPVHP